MQSCQYLVTFFSKNSHILAKNELFVVSTQQPKRPGIEVEHTSYVSSYDDAINRDAT